MAVVLSAVNCQLAFVNISEYNIGGAYIYM